jgi:F0F1-type ATP synthase membrane subunit c/vacuolar-type H+-ATPase subunit K
MVAATADPLIVTFTLSPVFHCVVAAGEASSDGLGAGVGETCAAGLGVALVVSFVFDSQAAAVSDNSRIAKTFFIINVLLFTWRLVPARLHARDNSEFAREWC